MARRSKTEKVPVEERPVPISTASYLTGIETHTLRYWEREFAEFLNPVRTTGGQRRYRKEDIEVLKEIKRLLKDELYTIAGAKRILAQKFGVRNPNPEGKNGTQKKATAKAKAKA